jgi:hypothetical protein
MSAALRQASKLEAFGQLFADLRLAQWSIPDIALGYGLRTQSVEAILDHHELSLLIKRMEPAGERDFWGELRKHGRHEGHPSNWRRRVA